MTYNPWTLPMGGKPTKAQIFDEYRRRLDRLAGDARGFLRTAYMQHPLFGPSARAYGFGDLGNYLGRPHEGGWVTPSLNAGVEIWWSKIIAGTQWSRYNIMEDNTRWNEANPGAPKKRSPNWDGLGSLRSWYTSPRTAAGQFVPSGMSPWDFWKAQQRAQPELKRAFLEANAQRKRECAAWFSEELARGGFEDTRPSRGAAKAGARDYLNNLAKNFTVMGPVVGSDKPGQRIRPGSPLDQSGGRPRPPGSEAPPYGSGGSFGGGASNMGLLGGLAAAAAAVLLIFGD